MVLLNVKNLSGPRKSHYVCETCGKLIAVVEVAPGVVPPTIGCTFGCGRQMRSCFYIELPPGSPDIPVTHELYRPEGSELIQLRGHRALFMVWKRGDLWLRKRTEAEPLTHSLFLDERTVKTDVSAKLKEVDAFFTTTGLRRSKALHSKPLSLGG